MRWLALLSAMALTGATTGCFSNAAIMIAAPVAQYAVMLPAAVLAPAWAPDEAANSEGGDRQAEVRLEDIERRAQAGDREAQYQLAAALEQGRNGAQDPARAAEWYRKAALRNHGRAQARLGALYEQGRGLPKDDVQAYMWYTLALDNGLRWVGPGFRDKLSEELSAQEIAEAEHLAMAWHKRHRPPQ